MEARLLSRGGVCCGKDTHAQHGKMYINIVFPRRASKVLKEDPVEERLPQICLWQNGASRG